MAVHVCEHCGGQSPQKVLYSIPEAAELLSIGEAYCWRLVRTGAIRTTRVGRRRLVPHTEIERVGDLGEIRAG